MSKKLSKTDKNARVATVGGIDTTRMTKYDIVKMAKSYYESREEALKLLEEEVARNADQPGKITLGEEVRLSINKSKELHNVTLSLEQTEVILNLISSEVCRIEAENRDNKISQKTYKTDKMFYVHLGDTLFGAMEKTIQFHLD